MISNRVWVLGVLLAAVLAMTIIAGMCGARILELL